MERGKHSSTEILTEHLLHTTVRIDTRCQNIETKMSDNQKETLKLITSLKVEIAKLQMKSGVWGALAGSIPPLVGYVIYKSIQ